MVHLHWLHLGIRGHHHHHHHHHHHQVHHNCGQRGEEVAPPMPPKGYMALKVGVEGEEQQQQRVVVPVAYLNHALFRSLLHDVEEVYGFDHKGPLAIPCRIDKFPRIQRIIEGDRAAGSRHRHHGSGGGGANHHGQFHCFNASLT